jgi:hypothetical protein
MMALKSVDVFSRNILIKTAETRVASKSKQTTGSGTIDALLTKPFSRLKNPRKNRINVFKNKTIVN